MQPCLVCIPRAGIPVELKGRVIDEACLFRYGWECRVLKPRSLTPSIDNKRLGPGLDMRTVHVMHLHTQALICGGQLCRAGR